MNLSNLWFTLGRAEGFPSNYGETHTAAHIDILEAGLILALVIIALACSTVLPAYTANGRWVVLATYGSVSLLVCGALLVSNFGYQWEVAHASIRGPYKPASALEMEGEIGLHVGLRGVNITLRGHLVHEATGEAPAFNNEVIDYNEHFSWAWGQGRFGFGPNAGRFSREYRAALARGSPIPILLTAEYFTFDGEGVRFGRHYRLAGYYSHFFMWVALCTWVLANVAFFSVVRMAALFVTATGAAQLLAILLWTFIRNPIEIQIPFQLATGSDEVLLVTRYGRDDWIVLATGALCMIGGIVLLVLDDFYKEGVCKVFGIDPLSVYSHEYKPLESLNTQEPPQTGAASMAPVISHRRYTSGSSIRNTFRRRKIRRAPSGYVTTGLAPNFNVRQPLVPDERIEMNVRQLRQKFEPVTEL